MRAIADRDVGDIEKEFQDGEIIDVRVEFMSVARLVLFRSVGGECPPEIGIVRERRAAEIARRDIVKERIGAELSDRRALSFGIEKLSEKNRLPERRFRIGERVEGPEVRQNLAQAVAAYRAALEIRIRELSPKDWALTQNNLGVALQDQGERTGGNEARDLLAQAVTAYRAALEVYTRQQSPQDWAMTQNNLGNALERLGEMTLWQPMG